MRKCALLLCALLAITSITALSAPKKRASSHPVPTYQLPETGILTQANIVAFTKRDADFTLKHSADEFSAPFDESPLIGRPFRIVIKPSIFGPVRFKYTLETHELRITVDGHKPFGMEFLGAKPDVTEILGTYPDLQGLLISGSANLYERDAQQNAMGAHVEVEKWNANHIYLAILKGALYIDGMPDGAIYSSTIKIAPEAARALSTSMVLVIEGTIAEYKPH